MAQRVTHLALIACLVLFAVEAQADVLLNLQGALFATARNDVRIPGDSGTKFSLADELKAETAFTGRIEAGYLHRQRDYFGIVVAPLRVASHGTMSRNVSFAGSVFPAGTALDATFRFDSYRLTWRRNWLKREAFDLWLGLTGNLRDAAITVKGGGQTARKSNIGVVPLINFQLDWRIARSWTLRLAGDALVGPQGRAEDVLGAVMYDLGNATQLFAGYRLLEGGADNDEVYTFSRFNGAVTGIALRF